MTRISTLALLPLVLIASGTFAFLSVTPAAASAPTPADAFIRSVVTRNGDLGWQQLCQPVQRVLPREKLVSEVQAQKAAEAGTGLTLTSTFVRQQALPQGGDVHVYELSAQRAADGWSGQLTYNVFTAKGSGCVNDVQTDGA